MAARDVYEDHDPAEAPREGLASGLVVLTTLLLIGAFLVMELARKKHFGDGLFGDKGGAGMSGTR
jgi:hypothetical protein